MNDFIEPKDFDELTRKALEESVIEAIKNLQLFHRRNSGALVFDRGCIAWGSPSLIRQILSFFDPRWEGKKFCGLDMLGRPIYE